jgi:hypothetical protein
LGGAHIAPIRTDFDCAGFLVLGIWCLGTEGSVMRNLSLAAFAVAFTFLFASILFIVASKYPSGVSSQLCSIGVSLCDRPQLLLVPAAASLAWAWMVRLIGRP